MVRLFDRDELGEDPEEDDEETPELCPDCLEPWDDCVCEDEEEEG